jgi:hypothetical protein
MNAMKKIASVIILGSSLFLGPTLLAVNGCIRATPGGYVKTVLDVAEAACVLVHDNVDDAHWIAKACNIADDYLPEIEKLVSARKVAAARKAAMAASASASSSSVPAPSSSSKKVP